MKRKSVTVRWTNGLHLRPAARLVRLAQRFSATIELCVGESRADLRSILSIVGLCALMGTTIQVEATGADEDRAAQAIERFFDSEDGDDHEGAAEDSPGNVKPG